MSPPYPMAVPLSRRAALAAAALTLAGCGGGDPVSNDGTDRPAGDRVAFMEGPLPASSAGGRTVLVDLSTGARRVLDDTLIAALNVRASPDGRALAYLVGQGGFGGTLWRRDLATGAMTRIPAGSATNFTRLLRWRADGWLEGTCAPEPNGGLRLCLVRADGSAAEVLPPAVPFSGAAALSPDGTRIAVTFEELDSSVGYETGIRLVARDGSGPRTLVAPSPRSVIDEIVWSPDGTRLVYVRTAAAGGAGAPRLITVRADGTDTHQLFPGDQQYGQRHPEWTADGTRLVFVQTPYYYMLTDPSELVELLAVDPGTAGPAPTLVTPEHGVRRWSPTWVRAH
jgi:Tol biopolymer transport system component